MNAVTATVNADTRNFEFGGCWVLAESFARLCLKNSAFASSSVIRLEISRPIRPDSGPIIKGSILDGMDEDLGCGSIFLNILVALCLVNVERAATGVKPPVNHPHGEFAPPCKHRGLGGGVAVIHRVSAGAIVDDIQRGPFLCTGFVLDGFLLKKPDTLQRVCARSRLERQEFPLCIEAEGCRTLWRCSEITFTVWLDLFAGGCVAHFLQPATRMLGARALPPTKIWCAIFCKLYF